MFISFKSNSTNQQITHTEKEKKYNSIHYTKQGNPYYHTSAGKKIGTGVALAGSLIASSMIGMLTKNFKIAARCFGFTAAFSLPTGFISGAIFDGLLNHHEKKKTDKMSSINA